MMTVLHPATAALLAGAAAISVASSAFAQTAASSPVAPQERTTFAPDGTVHVPAFDLPPSSFMSKEAADTLRARAAAPPFAIPANIDIATVRRGMEMVLSPSLTTMRQRYPVDVVEKTIAGVRTRVVTPRGKPPVANRILINLHGGGFSMCADACALLEALPIASVGGYRVVSVDYRQGPEAHFPAASEDVAAVYRELLRTYRPTQIGIYGCSAGGALSAQVAAWLPRHGLPQAGAIGIFGSGATGFATGDSNYLAGFIDGAFPPPPAPGTPPSALTNFTKSYFTGASMDDAMVAPAGHLDVLARFPPTLIITGTRAPDLSPAVYTHSQLVKAGIAGDLIVGEGMTHCYIYSANLPEAQDAYRAIVRFFQAHLH